MDTATQPASHYADFTLRPYIVGLSIFLIVNWLKKIDMLCVSFVVRKTGSSCCNREKKEVNENPYGTARKNFITFGFL